MNAPYIPGAGLWAGLNRRWARFASRVPMRVHTDHAIVSFSFDDFPKSAAIAGAAALEKRGWRGTYYASAGYAGGITHHGTMFDAGDLQRLTSKGHEIGCHTYSHLDAAAVPTSELLADVARNARALEAMGLETELESFAFAYGEATPAAKQALLEHFSNLRGVRARINRGATDRGLLQSVPLDGGEAGIARAVDAAHSLVGHPGWLIYYGHDVQDTPTQWGCTPDQLEQVCDAVEASGARVMTVAEALQTLDADA
ncbi:polysaccharide deacetylase family protein [Maricaulis parjimensis]|uniref:polysaccharide deacetylase family protein n=1 Tax=Maricaulis parjimensis TaxID=144023 RepID=UPI001939D4C7|nr:polysaccharide deacetylase family protein [Maricaulis parjimensis]